MQELARSEQCPHCGRFSNRGLSVDAVIIHEDRVLLIKRGIEPFKGSWATPGGYVEWDESAEDAVAREVKEETRLTVTSCQLITVRSNPDRHPKQVVNIVYLVDVTHTDAKSGDDAEELRWFPIDAIPKELAFDHQQNINDALRLIKNS